MRWLCVLLSLIACASAAPYHHYAGTSGIIKLQDHTRISHDTYYLGEREHSSAGTVRGYAFLNLHKSVVQSSYGAGLPRPQKAQHFNRTVRATHAAGHCTGSIAEGAAWRVSSGYTLHLRNRHSLSPGFLIDALALADDQWRCALNKYGRLVGGPLIRALDGSGGEVIDLGAPDGRNDIGFATIEGRPGTVAVTIVWGVFGGPISARRIIEFDMVFDGIHYQWGDASRNRAVMDVQSIATHEMGHRYGLDDVYDRACFRATMFGTSSEGETDKRSLHPIDVEGLADLYAQ